MNQIHELIQLLRIPVKSVPPNRQVLAFHFNTKFAHILNGWKCVFAALEHSPKLKSAQAAYGAWKGLACDFVACLPDIQVVDGGGAKAEISLTDPFAYLRQAFHSNRESPSSQIPQVVTEMWKMAKDFTQESGGGFAQDHRNLVELSTMCGFLPPEAEKAFCKEVFNMDKTTAEVLEEHLDELEGASMLDSVKKQKIQGGVLYQSSHRNWSVREDKLFVEGNGCISEFSLVRHENQIAVIDFQNRPQTSVTNLAESVHEAVTTTFGKDIEVFEAYPQDLLVHHPGCLSKILVIDGCAFWEHTSENIGGLLTKLKGCQNLAAT